MKQGWGVRRPTRACDSAMYNDKELVRLMIFTSLYKFVAYVNVHHSTSTNYFSASRVINSLYKFVI